jgi:NADPH-dependent glutamate synthase beta subunit-like oxidoreductase
MIRTVDQLKCVGCGTCQRTCPLDVFRLEVNQPLTSPCAAACPVNNNIRGMHYLLEMGMVDEAAKMMLENNPLASVTGRICPRFCESECSRKQVDAAVNISALEQYLGDYLLEKEVDRVPVRHVAPVAIVGSGPAGLSCAYLLAADGFRVTIFESKNEPGGMLRYAIPEYRLPSSVVASVVGRLQRMGVVIKCNEVLNRTFTLDDLRRRGFRAVFLGLGATKAKNLDVEGISANGVYLGLDFLEAVRTGHQPKITPRVVVIGGGDVAMDVAQTARRMGAQSVTVITLEEEAGLPAYCHNIDSARAEGIDFCCSYGIEKIVSGDGKAEGVKLLKCLSVFDGAGKFAPKLDRTDSATVMAETVIVAIGQETDRSCLPGDVTGPNGLIAYGLGTYQTSIANIFAAGDVVTGPASVAAAIGGGKRAAQAINFHLRGIELEQLPPVKMPVFPGLPEGAKLERAMRHEKANVRQVGSKDFSEIYQGFDVVDALAEADRCMYCGAKSIAAHLDDCMTCFNCELNCPSDAIFVHPFKEVMPRSLRFIEPDTVTVTEGGNK